MRVLVACERSGLVRDAFTRRGHVAMSCDLLPSDSPGFHYQGDVFDVINDGWDLMLAFPPCTFVCGSGWHWNKVYVGRHACSLRAIDFFERLWHCKIKRKCIENPSGVLSTFVEPPSQIINPYHFGDDAAKRTCLWLENLAKLRPTKYIAPRNITGLVDLLGDPIGPRRWANQTDSGQNALPDKAGRASLRSETFPGVADAMGEQWG